MSHRTIAIGDIHGCDKALDSLLGEINPTLDDTIVILGDCVDRGPGSRGVIEQLLAYRERCTLVPLMGNHEEMMLNFLDQCPQPNDWLYFGGRETLTSYDALTDVHRVSLEHIDFMRTWKDLWETENHFFVHGNYEPNRPLAKQRLDLYRWLSLRESMPAPHCSGKTAIVGHTSQKSGEILDLGYLKCIDTFCHGGGWLTALDVESGYVWQADIDGRLRG